MSSTECYLDCGGEPVAALVHDPAASELRDTAVLLCPPFGWHEVASYRIRGDWATELAAGGYLTMRISLPSTGDSAGLPTDPARLEAWTETIAGAVEWLRRRTHVERVAVLGLGLGGLVAVRAVAQGAPVDDLMLWATAGRGRSLVRELRALSRIEASQFTAGDPPAPPPGELHVGGFVLSAETVSALEPLDVSEMPLAAGHLRRVLLLERDGIAPDASLEEAFAGAGAAVEVSPGDGYAAMTINPQQARLPRAVVDRVAAWLSAGATAVASPVGGTVSGAGTAIPLPEGGAICERPLVVDLPFGRAVGVLAEPADPSGGGTCVVMLNAGAIWRIGPGRMWVEIARRWAARGIPVLRLDLEGIGDADGDATPYVKDGALYAPGFVDQAIAVLDLLQETGVAGRFILGGLCSGAYWSFHAALRDPRVAAASLLNARALFWEDSLMPSRDIKRAIARREWHKIRSVHPSRYWAVVRWALTEPIRRLLSAAARAAGRRPPDQVERSFDALRDAGKPVLLLFSEDEPLRKELIRSGHMQELGRWPNVRLELVAGRDHPLRPVFTQRQVHAAFDRWLEPLVFAQARALTRR